MNDHYLPQTGQCGGDHDGEVGAMRGTLPVASRAQAEGPISPNRFEPPASALGPLFRYRLEQIHICRVNPVVQVSTRPTLRVLGGYYKSRRLVRVYSHRSRLMAHAPARRAFRDLPPRGGPSSRVHRAPELRLARVPPDLRADAQPAFLADFRRAQVALGQTAIGACAVASGEAAAGRKSSISHRPVRIRA